MRFSKKEKPQNERNTDDELTLVYKELKGKPGKKGYKMHTVPKNHPRRKMNQKIKDDKQRNFFRAALG